MTDLTMPRLSDSMVEGTILSWLKGEGETVEAGEDLVEIETDKATITHPAETSGVLYIVAPEGTSLPVGATIARLSVRSDQPAGQASVAASDGSSAAARGATSGPQAVAPVLGNGDRASGLVQATPVAPTVDLALGTKGDIKVIEPTRLQMIVARRMTEAKATIPHFQIQTEVAMEALIALREELKGAGADVVPSFNDLIVKAAALALRAHPLANGAYRDGHFERYARVNIGIAVAAKDALLVPTLFDVDEKSLAAIAAEARRLIGRVGDGSVTPSELTGATFTVSNLGMYGMTAIMPVVNAPQAAILGVGAMREALARVDGEIIDRQLMTLTLSCDHRILYGAQAAEFLSMIRELLEQPLPLSL